MESHENNPATAGIFQRFFRWLFSWRTVRRALIALVGLVTLVALFWTEENWRGKHEWEKYKTKWEAKGERFDFASFVPKPIPDEENFFKAPIWAGALNREWINPHTGEVESNQTHEVDDLQINPYGPANVGNSNADGNWRNGTLTDLKAWQNYYHRVAAVTNFFPIPKQPQSPANNVLFALSRYDSAIEALRVAAQRPGSRLPLDYDDLLVTMSRLFPILGDFKGCVQLLELRAVAELSSGKNADAFSDVKLMFRLADSIRNQPFLVSHLVRVAIVSITVQPIYEGMARHQWNDAQLAGLESALANEDFLADYEFAMRGERAFGILLTESSPQYRSFPFRHQWELANARMFEKWILPRADLKVRVISPANIRRLQKAEAREWKHTTPYNVLSKIMLPALDKAVVKFARVQVAVDLARVACGLERYRLAHGDYPETMGSLAPQFIEKIPHDIIGGQPLKYRRIENGKYLLYSVGWNETDDNGQIVHHKDGNPDLKQGDWVWQIPAK